MVGGITLTYKRMLALAILFASLAAFGAFKYLQNLAVQANIQQLPYETVIVAKQDIQINKVIDSKDIEVKKVLQGDEHPNVFKDSKDIIGKVAVTKITSGEQILNAKVAAKGDVDRGLGFIVSERMRAVTVAISEVTGVGYMIKPGDRVDLLVRVTKDLPTKEKKVGVGTLLQNVKVLALGKNLTREPIDEKAGEAKSVTLEVYPVDAEKIFLASQDAMLLLTLRSPGEKTIQKLPVVQYEDLAPDFFKASQAKEDKNLVTTKKPSTGR